MMQPHRHIHTTQIHKHTSVVKFTGGLVLLLTGNDAATAAAAADAEAFGGDAEGTEDEELRGSELPVSSITVNEG